MLLLLLLMVCCVLSSREQIDAQVAKQLAEKMEREELERQQALEEGDREIAHKLQVSMTVFSEKLYRLLHGQQTSTMQCSSHQNGSDWL